MSKQGQRTRQQILAAAQESFIKHGYHGTSMRRIAKGAGIALGGIYNHFPSKESLFRTVFDQNHPYREVLPALQDAQGEDLEGVVRDAAESMTQALERQPGFLNLMLIEIVEFEGKHMPDLFEQVLPELLNIATRLERQGERLRQIPIFTLLRAFVGLFFSYYLTEFMMREVAELKTLEEEAVFEDFVEIFLHGVLLPD